MVRNFDCVTVCVGQEPICLLKGPKIGASFGMSHFAIGVLIVGLGTSLPRVSLFIGGGVRGSTERS